jgi:hypothetical protein
MFIPLNGGGDKSGRKVEEIRIGVVGLGAIRCAAFSTGFKRLAGLNRIKLTQAHPYARALFSCRKSETHQPVTTKVPTGTLQLRSEN